MYVAAVVDEVDRPRLRLSEAISAFDGPATYLVHSETGDVRARFEQIRLEDGRGRTRRGVYQVTAADGCLGRIYGANPAVRSVVELGGERLSVLARETDFY